MAQVPFPSRPGRFQPPSAPPPFWRRTELQLVLHVGLLLVLCCAGLWMYVSSRPTEGPHQGESSAPAAQPVAMTPEARAELERNQLALFEGALTDSKNGDELGETRGYYKLLQVVSDYTPEEVTSRAKRFLDRDAVMKDPDVWRGEFVWARGVLAGLTATPLDTRGYGRGMVFRGAITDGDATGGILIDLPEHPGQDLGVKSGAYDVEGVFFRTVRFENRDGKQTEAPWLIVRNIRPAPVAAAAESKVWLNRFGPWLLAGLALAILTWRVLAYVFQRRARRERRTQGREPQTIREMFEQRLREERVPPPPSGSA